MQQQDGQLYREQRRVPKVISPQDTDNHGGTIKLVEAPRAHEMVRCYLHDCEYAKIGEIRAGIKQTNKSATPPSKANAQPSTIVTAARAADQVHVATAALNAIVAHAVTEAHAAILAHVVRAARLVAKEKAKPSDKIPLRIVPSSLYRLTRRSYLTTTLAVRYPRFRLPS
jgi:hypothetical protein